MPALVPAVNAFDVVATPLAFVVSVSVATAPANVPFGSDEGAVNVAVTPDAGEPPDVTVATSCLPKAAPVVALCPPPLVAVMATVGGVVWDELDELELPQPVKRLTARQGRAAKNAPRILLFIASLPFCATFWRARSRDCGDRGNPKFVAYLIVLVSDFGRADHENRFVQKHLHDSGQLNYLTGSSS